MEEKTSKIVRRIEDSIIGFIVTLFLAVLLLFGGRTLAQAQVAQAQVVEGKASWYGGKFHGRYAADGSIFNKHAFTTAATKRYKLGDVLKVTNASNGKTVIVKVTDRGAFKKYGRLLDLSRAAFAEIGDLRKGVIKVLVEKVK